MTNPLLDALGTVGYAFDTPGAYLRGALAGRPGERASGQDLLSTYGLSDANDPWGGVKGFGVEALVDPLSLAAPVLGGLKGITAGTRAARAVAGLGEASPLARRLAELKAGVEEPLDAVRMASRAGESANPLARAVGGFAGDESGAMRPFMEIGRRTDPDYINSVPWWHGTATPGLTPEALDPMKTDPGGLFGRGIYKTADPNIAGGPGGYAEARRETAASKWPTEANRVLFPKLLESDRGGTSLGPAVTSDLITELRRDVDTGDRVQDHWLEYGPTLTAIEQAMGRKADSRAHVPHLLNILSRYPEGIDASHAILGKHGLHVPAPPRSTVYEANTNLGKILDLDAPPPRDVVEMWQHMVPQHNALLREPPDLTSDLITQMKAQSQGWWSPRDFNPPSSEEPDQLIQALRGAGYDALSHTGGLRAGGGRNLHQVLISLDPNDTISRVGRAGQITRFEPQDIPELLRRFGGG